VGENINSPKQTLRFEFLSRGIVRRSQQRTCTRQANYAVEMTPLWSK